MTITRLCAVLAVICLLAISFNKGLLPLAQALPLEPAQTPPAQAESKTEAVQTETVPPQIKNYDIANPDFTLLQEAKDALTGLALDRKYAVDWMKALNRGVIVPRANVLGTAEMEFLESDIIMTNTKRMPYVNFPHSSHTRWLACANCHDEIFIPKAGANKIDMEKIFRGQFCGVCHGKVAFVVTLSCERCHSIPQRGAKAWW